MCLSLCFHRSAPAGCVFGAPVYSSVYGDVGNVLFTLHTPREILCSTFQIISTIAINFVTFEIKKANLMGSFKVGSL